MKKLYKPVIVKKEINDEHYYYIDGKFTPSVTKILHEALPMPYSLLRWYGDLGVERAEARRDAAGERGSLIHDTCEKLMNGLEINLKEIFSKKSDQKAIVGFVNWFNEYKPEFKPEDIEKTIASQYGYAGTLDLFCRISGEPVIVDFKSSNGMHDSYKLQITAYQQAFFEMTGIKAKRWILHLNPLVKSGYTLYGEDKMKIKGKPVKTEDFLKVFEVYKMLNGGKIPEPDLEEVYPDTIKLFEEKEK